MTFEQLPALCIDLIIRHLIVTGIIRRHSDIVCDCLVLGATSKQVRKNVSFPLPHAICPTTELEAIPTNKSNVSYKLLRAACRNHNLCLRGNAKTLRTRLQHAGIDDSRSELTHLGRNFSERAKSEVKVCIHQDTAIELLNKLGLSYKNLPYTCVYPSHFAFRPFVRWILKPYGGNEHTLFAARRSLVTAKLDASHKRLILLSHALNTRGVQLRGDCDIIQAYLRDDECTGTLTEIVNALTRKK